MFTSIAGRAVVVTGGTRGIGKGIASVFARNGARVLITGRDSDVARAAAEELDALAARPRRGLVRPGRRVQPGGLPADGGERHGAAGRHRRAVRQRRGLPRQPAGGHDRGGPRPGARGQPEGHGVLGPGLPARAGRARAGAGSSSPRRSPGRSPGYPGWTALRREQGRPAGLHADRRDRAGAQRHHGQRGAAGQHRHRRPGRARRGLRGGDGGLDPAAPPGHASTRSATPRCSWPPTRRATSPGRRSWSTAARCCPRPSKPSRRPRRRMSADPCRGSRLRRADLGGGPAGAGRTDRQRPAPPRAAARGRARAGRRARGQPGHAAPGARGARGGRGGPPGARPRRRHVRGQGQDRAGPVPHRRGARAAAQPGRGGRDPGAVARGWPRPTTSPRRRCAPGPATWSSTWSGSGWRTAARSRSSTPGSRPSASPGCSSCRSAVRSTN